MVPAPPREPMPGPQQPRAEGEDTHHTQSHGCVVERLRRDRVFRRQTEHDGDEGDPEASDDGEWLGRGAEVEGSAFEVAGVDDAHGDGDAVGEVEADCGDGSRAVECDGGAERGEGEEEGTAGAKEDRTDWGVKAPVDDVEPVRDTAVTGEGEHHAGVGGLRQYQWCA